MSVVPAPNSSEVPASTPGSAVPVTASQAAEVPQAWSAFLLVPPRRAAIYVFASLLMFLTQGLGMNLLTANIYQLQGSFSATTTELAWLQAVYMAPYASFSVALFKIRSQFGLRRFAELGILCFVVASAANLFVSDYHSALVVRFISGCAAAPLSTIGILFMLEPFAPQRKLTLGLSLALMNTLLSAPLARVISPHLMDLGGFHALYTLEMGLALIALPFIYLLPMTPPPRAKVIQPLDVLSYFILATGLGCLAVVLALGRFYWWLEAPWLGVTLAVSIGCLTLFGVIELNRASPFLDLRWVFSRQNMMLAAVLIVFRTVSSEQSTTASGLLQQIGLLNDQTMTLYALVMVGSVIGGLACAALMTTRHADIAHLIALVLIGAGAFLDSQSTALTRPEQMYLSQALISAGAAMFLPPAMSRGMTAAFARGAPFLVNFIIIFLFTQSIGSLMASAALGSFVTIREKFHSNHLVEHLVLSNPLVANRVSQLSATYGKVIGDPAILKAEGLQLLGQQATREAYVLAYNDTFFLIFVVCLVSLVVLLAHMAFRALKARRAPPSALAAAPSSA
ncbi:MFS transporter [Rhizobium rhizosphaerae]|uniref:MFS transporter n=1 Tax=Xaviernesmea rhizosphaerae TaxID=1672749 RepID=A0ABX3PCD1_9HYPH|nr:MFS transporter [Xaviernesmea rhizosphaerae]